MPTTQQIILGDCIEGMRTLPDASVHCCVTSPPYWNQRDYGHDGQIGLESTPEAYVARMVEVFREVRRVLRWDGCCWINLGDTYSSGKQLVGIPWRVAFALQADGWLLRHDIIWQKTAPMPESVTDRCTKAHEYVFLLAKSERYYYDAEAVKEENAEAYRVPRQIIRRSVCKTPIEPATGNPMRTQAAYHEPGKDAGLYSGKGRNRRSVWTISTKPYSGAHFAVMPPDLVEPCIKAGCPEGGTVLDPFAGSGTTLAVAAEQGRNAIGCELNPEYIALAKKRIREARESVALFDGIS